ncbi:PepSY domain-containing protein [Amaricoccus sp.]|uniref:PepSY domain-containing protein n=1 Tax=Amaricoccus sp. TaxID=1872485 RepID=UPI0026080CDB|nr:PepSY domain-containing protein [Amaricoccus sp.]HRO11486.1 PepSY domain-containing protein [Amaricoccus sp.]
MKPLALSLLALACAAPALADPSCKGTEATMPMWQVAKAFEDAGGKIREMKVSDGCYEIYGTNGETKLEIYYDPASGAELQRESD